MLNQPSYYSAHKHKRNLILKQYIFYFAQHVCMYIEKKITINIINLHVNYVVFVFSFKSI